MTNFAINFTTYLYHKINNPLIRSWIKFCGFIIKVTIEKILILCIVECKTSIIIETPNMPLNVRVDRVQLSVHPEPYTFSVRWDVPDNSEKFDLEGFKVRAFAMLSEQESRCIVNETTIKLEYYFISDIIPPQMNINTTVTVTAISKCSQQGVRSHAVVWSKGEDVDKIMFTSAISKTEDAFRSYYIVANGKI